MEYIENKELEEKEIKGIFTDMLKYAPSKLCGMFGNMIAVPIYTSLFSQQEYGLYTISIAMLSFLCIIFSDWVGLSGLRFFRKHQLVDDLPKYLTTLVTILAINMVLMFGIAFIFRNSLYNFFHVPFKYFLAVLFLIIPVAIRALLSQLLRAQLKSISYTVATILNQFATILMAVGFAKCFNMGPESILLGMGVSISLIDILLLYQSEILKVFKFKKNEWKFIIPVICYGVPLTATLLSALVITQNTEYITNIVRFLFGPGYIITLPILIIIFTLIIIAAIIRNKFIIPIICYGVPLAATSLSAWIITQSNKFIMNSISGFEKAALVGAGYGITLPILMPLVAMITVAAIPRIINLYEGKVDVRPIITNFLGYYILVALPLVTVMSLYSLDVAHIFIKNPQMYEASQLVPYFAYGVFFLAMTDYTTLQYHLANKTHIEFTIKLISGIIGVGLNFALIPKFGLTGVGIATFAANFLYCILSMIIVIPNLNLYFPKNMIARIFVALIPAGGLWYAFKILNTGLSGAIQMITLLLAFYLVYFFVCRKYIKIPE